MWTYNPHKNTAMVTSISGTHIKIDSSIVVVNELFIKV